MQEEKRKPYPSDLTDAQWEFIKPLLPPPAETGRPRIDERETINGILYVLTTGCAWEYLPHRSNHVTVPKGRPPKDKHEKRYCRQRWKVERGFAWINNCRRLDRFLEESQKTYRAFMRVFFIKHYLDRLF